MADPAAVLRLRLPLDTSVPRLLSDAGYRVETTRPSQRRLTLYDTGDRRLAAGGAELALHARDGWTWRRTGLGHPKLASREWAAPADGQEEQVLTWSRAYRRGSALAPRAGVVVHRRTHRVVDGRSTGSVLVHEERIDESSPARTVPRVRRVVISVDDTGRGIATGAIRALRDTAVRDAPSLALLRPASVRAPRLRLSEQAGSTRELFARSVTLSVIQWLYFDCELAAGGTVEAVRKVRVALRRMRTDLQTFRPVLDRGWSDLQRERLAGLAAQLGVCRDAEVLVERLAASQGTLPEPDAAAALPLLDVAREQHADARARLLDTVAGADYLDVLEGAIVAATAPTWLENDAPPAAVTTLARRPWRRLRSAVAAAGSAPDDSQLHRIRILTKRARYAADACVPAVGDPAAASATALAELQTVLGDHHDAAVTCAWLRQQAEMSPHLSFVAGQLAALEARRGASAAQRWRGAWAAASRRKDWRWLGS